MYDLLNQQMLANRSGKIQNCVSHLLQGHGSSVFLLNPYEIV